MAYDVGNPGPVLGQAQKCVGVGLDDDALNIAHLVFNNHYSLTLIYFLQGLLCK
jgi:hypothetical protein